MGIAKSFLAVALLVIAVPSIAFGKDKAQGPSCEVKFSVIQKDALGNIQQGLKSKQLKWATTDLFKKYPDVCYVPPDQIVTVVFFITVAPATYHGTRTVSTTSDTSGTVNADDGSTATYEGKTTSQRDVPEEFEYGKFTLSVQTMTPDKHSVVRHRFEQDGIYSTLYGIPLGGRGHHPQQAVIEDAVKWIHNGGLQDPMQSTQ